jgi:Tol biopolymer transport system component
MSDLRERLTDIEGISPPDLWDEITGRPLHQSSPERAVGTGRRLAVTLLALAIAVAGLGFAVVAFRSNEGSTPVTSVIPVANGPIWALGAGGEAGSYVFSVDPLTGRETPLWSDGRTPDFPDFRVDQRLIGYDYAFSPDGSKVAFSTYAGYGAATQTSTEIFVMDTEGSNLVQVTHDNAYASSPSWSPDGARIAYSSYRGSHYIPGCLGSTLCPSDLFVIGVDGIDQHQLTEDPGDESMPNWSPDGTSIVFRSASGDSLGAVSVIGADGSGVTQLSNQPDGWVQCPAWSPDGGAILFLGEPRHEDFGVWVMNADGSQLHQLTDTNADTGDTCPVWSPDGTEIAYAKRIGGELQLWIMSRDGSEPHEVAELPKYGIQPLAWQPMTVPSGSSPPS